MIGTFQAKKGMAIVLQYSPPNHIPSALTPRHYLSAQLRQASTTTPYRSPFQPSETQLVLTQRSVSASRRGRWVVTSRHGHARQVGTKPAQLALRGLSAWPTPTGLCDRDRRRFVRNSRISSTLYTLTRSLCVYQHLSFFQINVHSQLCRLADMGSLLFFALSLLFAYAPFSSAQNTPQVASTSLSSSTDHPTQTHQTTFATSTSASTSPSPTSVIQATRHESGYGTIASAAPSNAVNTVGGASGTDSSSFHLSNGGLIAIIVVVAVVAVFGSKWPTLKTPRVHTTAPLTSLTVASIVLYVLAKKRQWNVRQSIKRASRRLTGRQDTSSRRSEAERRKRSGIVAGSKPGVKAADPPGHKRGVVVEVEDEEKGPLDYGTPPKTKKPREKSRIQRLWGNDWE